MKTVWRNMLLCCLLLALLAAQLPLTAFAADDEPQLWYLQGDRPDENGAWTSEYWVDADGNRMPETTSPQKRLRAAAADLPRSYDLRDYGLVTPVKFQAGAESCWAFGTVASLESNYILQGYGTAADTDFSEAHLVWFSQHQRTTNTADPTYGDGMEVSRPFAVGGHWLTASSTLMRGSGLQLEQNAPWITSYNETTLMQMEQQESDRYVSYARLWSVRKIADNSPTTLKQLIMQNGAATLSYYDNYTEWQNGNIEVSGYTSDKTCYFQTAQTNTTNHTVTVVGWDDDFSRTNFNEAEQPTGDGAWLIKGSYSTVWGDEGYYWISYEDPSLDQFVSFVAAPADVYDHIYQYDGSYTKNMFSVSNSAKMANVFTAERNETLTHAAFYSPNTSSVKATVEVYVAPEGFQYAGKNPITGMEKISAATTVVSSVNMGYTTVELNSPVTLAAGRKFTVVVTLEKSGSTIQIPVEGYSVNDPGDGVVTCAGNTGESFFCYGSSWYDTNAYNSSSGTLDLNNVPVKAMTCDPDTTGGATLSLASAPTKTTYTVGETLDTAGLSLLYTDENGVGQTVTQGFTCSPTILNTIGTQTVTVTYGGLTVTFTVTVEPYATTLSLASLPTKTTYKVGETLNTAGLSLLYSDEYGAQQTVTSGFTCRPRSLTTIGTQTVTVTYSGLTVTFDVTVEPYTPTLELWYYPDTVDYMVGDQIDLSGLVLMYTDEYGNAYEVDEGFACDTTTLSESGTQTVTVTYNDLSVTFDVEVSLYDTSLELTSAPTKTTYKVGETLDTTGLSLLYTDEYGIEQTVTEGFTCSQTALDAIGTQTVMVTYGGHSVTFDVTVEPYTPTLTLQSAPDKLTYGVGETLDTTGLSLLYTDEYGDALVVTEGFACDTTMLSAIGTQTVTVSYGGLSVTFDVTVMQSGLFLVSDAAARAGGTVDVAVRIADNPGIVSAWLELSYDTSVLELTAVNNGEIFADSCFTPGNDLTATPFRVLFLDALTHTDYTQNGDLVVFTFRVRPDAPAGVTSVTLTYKQNSTCNVDLQNIPFRTQAGTFSVQRLPGDVNADGVVNLKDVVLLRRYLANWDVTANLSNADVDQKEGVNLKDVALISRYLAGGYDVTLL